MPRENTNEIKIMQDCYLPRLNIEHFSFQGFEPRGTELANRLVTFENLVKNVNNDANLEPFPTPVVEKYDDLSHRVRHSTDNVTKAHDNLFCGSPGM